MNGQFAQLAAMQPQAPMGGMPPAPPPQPGPVGGRLAQLWEAFKTDPNMRQAVLQASTAMMQSPPPGQNSFGMIGAGIQHGANTLDKLRDRDRGQKVEQERFDTAVGQRQQGIDLQKRGLEESVTARQEDREARQDDRRRDRRFQSLLTMNAQDFQSTERDLDRQLQRELAQKQVDAGGKTMHPNSQYDTFAAEAMYNENPSVYDAKATEINKLDRGSRTGLGLAIAEQVRLRREADAFIKSDPDFFKKKAWEARLGVEGAFAEDPLKAAILDQLIRDDPELVRRAVGSALGSAPAVSGQDTPQTPTRTTPTQAPRPPIMSLEPGASPARGEKGQTLDSRVQSGEARIFPETGETLFLRGSQQSGFWVENREGKRFEIPPGYDNFPPLGR